MSNLWLFLMLVCLLVACGLVMDAKRVSDSKPCDDAIGDVALRIFLAVVATVIGLVILAVHLILWWLA